MSKSKEIWLSEMYECATGIFDNKEEAIENAWNGEENVTHFVEYSALEAANQEIARLRALGPDEAHSEKITDFIPLGLSIVAFILALYVSLFGFEFETKGVFMKLNGLIPFTSVR